MFDRKIIMEISEIILPNSLNISGKMPPCIGGGWSSSNYKVNEFIKRARNIGVTFEKQNGGHYKAIAKDYPVNDTLTISLHRPTTDGAKDMIRYMTKYNIIKVGYHAVQKEFEIGKKFSEHEKELFELNNDLEFDYFLDINKKINRKKVLEYVKLCFLSCDKIDFKYLVDNVIENHEPIYEVNFIYEKLYNKYKIVKFLTANDVHLTFGDIYYFVNDYNINDWYFVFRYNKPYSIIGLKRGILLNANGNQFDKIDEELMNIIVDISKQLDLIDNLTIGDFEKFSHSLISILFEEN